MLKLFRRIDPRIAADLKVQRKTILKGLFCVAVTSALTGATLGLTGIALQAIQDAAREPFDTSLSVKGAREVSQIIGISELSAKERIQKILSRRPPLPPTAAELAQEFNLQPARADLASKALTRAAQVAKAQALDSTRQDRAIFRLGLACLGVILLFALKYAFTRGQMYYLSRASSRMASDLRVRLFDKLMKLPVAYFNNRRTGVLQSIITNDVGVYQNAVSMIRDSIDGPAKALISLAVIFVIQWQLSILAMMFVPVLAWIVKYNGEKIKDAQSIIQADLATVTGMSNEALAGTRVIKAFSAEARIKSIFATLVERQYESQLIGARRFATLRPMVELMGAVAIALIMYVCGYLAKFGTLELWQIIVVVQALDQINQGFKGITNVSSTYNQVQAAVDRIHTEILDVEEEGVDSAGLRTLVNTTGTIEFRNVTFSYPDGTQALNNVSFILQPGHSLALVGPSGAGKSTIADLLLRFYDPTAGAILLDGVDYRELDTKWLRSLFGVVPQQTLLFAGTIAENLRLGQPSASESDLNTAATQANALEFIESSPDGFQTELGERGTRLSGGELQRSAIARALVRQPKVLLLDEATSNLDAVSEKVVTQALDQVMQGRTTLFIAHRLTTASRADRILVLRKGEVLEMGSHTELMAANAAYAGMYRAFTSGVIGGDLG